MSTHFRRCPSSCTASNSRAAAPGPSQFDDETMRALADAGARLQTLSRDPEHIDVLLQVHAQPFRVLHDLLLARHIVRIDLLLRGPHHQLNTTFVAAAEPPRKTHTSRMMLSPCWFGAPGLSADMVRYVRPSRPPTLPRTGAHCQNEFEQPGGNGLWIHIKRLVDPDWRSGKAGVSIAMAL